MLSKQVTMINQASTTNAATASGNVDTLGFGGGRLKISVLMATSNDTTNNPSVFKLSECDTTVVTDFANISGTVGDTDWTIPTSETAATNTPAQYMFDVDLRGRKRYIKISISPVTTQVITAIANLYRGDEDPVSATEAGVAAVIRV